jgi:predicted dehydrogenase
VAVAGLGAIGLLHAHHLAKVPEASLRLVVDRDEALARAATEELGVPWSASYEDALASSDVDAVVIATPTPLHADMVVAAARAGKHIFCEKPLSLDPDGGRTATAAAAAAGVCLQVGFQRRFERDFLDAKARLEAGEAGDLQFVRITHRNRMPPHEGDLSQRLGSALIDMTIHDFDTARWLVGEISEVHAFANGRTGIVVVRFENGALGVIDNSRAAVYGFECAVELMGTQSTLRIRWDSTASGVERLSGEGRLASLPADHIERHREAYLDELRHFVACARSGRRPAVGGAEAVAALELSLVAERCVK